MIIWEGEGTPEVMPEDSGRALIIEVSNGWAGDHEVFARLHSYVHGDAKHGPFGDLEGKRVRVTVEVVE